MIFLISDTIDPNTCGGLLDIVIVLRKVIDLIKILIPIGLIIFGLLDLGKAVMAGKEDEMKKAQNTLIKRVIYAVAVFLVITIVTAVMGLIDANGWSACWNAAGGSTAVGDAEG